MRLIACNYIVNLEKLGLADERTTQTVAFKPRGGALPYKPIRDVTFFRVSFFSINWFPERSMKIDQKFRNGLLLFVQEQKAAVFKNNRLLFSPTVFLLFCDLKIPKQGIKMQIFFLNGFWRLSKNGHLPVKLHSRDFFCLFWWEMFTTDTIVYPCEQNQNRYENGLAPVNTGKFTFQKSDWFDTVTIRDLFERSLR